MLKVEAHSDDAGMSMVEVVLAMLLVGLMSIGVLPLIIGITQHSVANRELLRASQVADARISEVQAIAPAVPGQSSSCGAVQSLITALGGTDAETGFTTSFSAPACPGVSAYPTVLPVSVSVARDGRTITTVTTQARVSEP